MILLEVVTLKGKPIGLVAAISKSCIGYALYNTVKEKRNWDIGLATKIAVGRAEKGRTDPMEGLSDVSEMFGLDMEKFEGTCDEKYYIARDGYNRVFLMRKAVKEMILKAKRRRW